MMISPKAYYEYNLKGKSAQQIKTIIRGLKNEIGRLKNIIEHPSYVPMRLPTEQTQLSCAREYLDRAIVAFAEAGGVYEPSHSERRAALINADMACVTEAELTVCSFFEGDERSVMKIEGGEACITIERFFRPRMEDAPDSEAIKVDKAEFIAELSGLNIGEWRRKYDVSRFGITVMDGIRWSLRIFFSNRRKALVISGENDYPYNFSELTELFMLRIGEQIK